MAKDAYDVSTTVVLESAGGNENLKLRFNFFEEPKVVAQRFVDEYSLPAYAKRYVLEYLKQYKMCVIKRQIPQILSPKKILTKEPPEEPHVQKTYDVVTSIEKAKSGLNAYINPWAYMNPMEEMKLYFNYSDDSSKIASKFVKKHGLSKEDHARIIDWIDSIKSKHAAEQQQQLVTTNGSSSVSAPQTPPPPREIGPTLQSSSSADYLGLATADQVEKALKPDILTTIAKPGKPGLVLEFHSSGDPVAAAKQFVAQHELSAEDEVKIVAFLRSKQAAIRGLAGLPLTVSPTHISLEALTRGQVLQWIHAMQLDCFRSIFLEIGVDGSIVADMEIDDLLELKVCTRIECKKLLKAIRIGKSEGVMMTALETREQAPHEGDGDGAPPKTHVGGARNSGSGAEAATSDTAVATTIEGRAEVAAVKLIAATSVDVDVDVDTEVALATEISAAVDGIQPSATATAPTTP